MKKLVVLGVIILSLAAGVVVSGQQTTGNSQEIEGYVSAAREFAGERYSKAMERMCSAPADRYRPTFADRSVEPVKIFDNVYFLGMANVYAWAVDTPEGIILLDSLDPEDAEEAIIGGMGRLGLDPARIRYVVVTHGHRDHYGGASLIQERYGARVMVSEADWNLIEQTESEGNRGPVSPPLKRDMVVTDGQTLTLGGTTLKFVLTPGHTPGALSVILPVTDQGRPHTVALMNGPRVTSLENARQMLASTEKFAAIAKEAGVDVEFNNHSYIDDSLPIIEATRNRRPGAPHPFLIGEDGFQNFTGWMAECLKAEVARRVGQGEG